MVVVLLFWVSVGLSRSLLVGGEDRLLRGSGAWGWWGDGRCCWYLRVRWLLMFGCYGTIMGIAVGLSGSLMEITDLSFSYDA